MRQSARVGPAVAPGAPGKIAYTVSPYGAFPSQLWIMNGDGTDQHYVTGTGVGQGDNSPAWSPGGTMIAFTRDVTASVTDDSDDLYVVRPDGSGLRRLTNTAAGEYAPAWSPDGSRIAFTSTRAGNFEIYTVKVDGSDVRRITNHAADDGHAHWSPDGTRIAFWSIRSGNPEIYTIKPDGTGLVRLTTNAGDDFAPSWSPDGTKIAWMTTRTGEPEIFVMNANGTGAVNLSQNPGWPDGRPAWSPDGQWVAFESYEYGDADVHIIAPTGGTEYWLTDELTDEWNPDWQPIPEFALVDARFSPFDAAIRWAYDTGVTKGCSDERYCPDDNVTREQMASFLVRALGLTGTAPDAFTDDESSIHEANMNLLAQAGITTGCDAALFCPKGLVRRDQMASFMARALELTGTAPDAFTDDDGNIHESNINRVAQANITTGCGGTNYCPKAYVTRGQMAAFLYRAFAP